MSLLREMKRRKVFQVATMYAVVAWLLVEVVTTVEDPLNLPDWVDSFVILLLAIGFPIALILSWAFDVTPEGIKRAEQTDTVGVSRQSSAMTFTHVSQALVLLAVLFLVIDEYMIDGGATRLNRPSVPDVTRYTYKLPDGQELVPTTGVSIAVSADGARFAYVGPSKTGRQLWVRERDQLQSTPVPGSEGALQPFFAPDGQGIGFVTEDRQLKILTRIGDPPLTIVDGSPIPLGAAWGVDGYVYFSAESGLMRKSATGGGNPEPVTFSEAEGTVVVRHGWPNPLPNGKGAILTISRDHLADEIAVVDFSTGQVRVLAEGSVGRYAESGHLVHIREDGGLLATPFDQDRLTAYGPQVRLNEQLQPGWAQDLAVSRNGRLIYTTNNAIWEVVWVDRDGNWMPVDAENPMQGIRYVALSPDNTKIAVSTLENPGSDNGHVWTKQLPRGPFAQLTFEGAVNMRPSWSPDGQFVAFISDRGENRDAWIKRYDGAVEAKVLLDNTSIIDEVLYSSTGDWLVYRQGKEHGDRDILAIRPVTDTEPRTLVSSSFDEVAPSLSADSRWLAYVSNRGGQANVYVRPFPDADREYLVSVNGGTEPVWSRTRPELYYRDDQGDMVMVPVLAGTGFETGPQKKLFSAIEYRRDFYHAAYDVSSDGQRFLMIRASKTGSVEEDLVVVENWFEELNQLAPTN